MKKYNKTAKRKKQKQLSQTDLDGIIQTIVDTVDEVIGHFYNEDTLDTLYHTSLNRFYEIKTHLSVLRRLVCQKYKLMIEYGY